MDETPNTADKWLSSTTEMLEAYKELLTMRLVEHTSLGIAVSIVGGASLLVGLFILLFASLGFAWWLGEYLNNLKAGFFLVGGGYAFIFLALLLTNKKIILPRIRNSIIKKMYEQDN